MGRCSRRTAAAARTRHRALLAASCADRPAAWRAATIAPTLHPATRSTGMPPPRAASTPRWAKARAPPPASTRPRRPTREPRDQWAQRRLRWARRPGDLPGIQSRDQARCLRRRRSPDQDEVGAGGGRLRAASGLAAEPRGAATTRSAWRSARAVHALGRPAPAGPSERSAAPGRGARSSRSRPGDVDLARGRREPGGSAGPQRSVTRRPAHRGAGRRRTITAGCRSCARRRGAGQLGASTRTSDRAVAGCSSRPGPARPARCAAAWSRGAPDGRATGPPVSIASSPMTSPAPSARTLPSPSGRPPAR